MLLSKNKSLVCFSPNAAARRRLICFPCAGGGASMYRQWAKWLPDTEIWAASYPGRETLSSLPFAESHEDVLALLMEQENIWQDKNLVLYGHSFGAFMAFAAALDLQRQGVRAEGLIVSARRAPLLPASERIGDLSDARFLAQLDRLGGIPAAIRHDADMMAYYLPIIRADLKLNDNAQTDSADVIDSPVYLFSAQDDHAASEEELDAWRYCTRQPFVHRVLAGGHFFIQDDAAAFIACVRNVMSGLAQENEELIAF